MLKSMLSLFSLVILMLFMSSCSNNTTVKDDDNVEDVLLYKANLWAKYQTNDQIYLSTTLYNYNLYYLKSPNTVNDLILKKKMLFTDSIDDGKVFYDEFKILMLNNDIAKVLVRQHNVGGDDNYYVNIILTFKKLSDRWLIVGENYIPDRGNFDEVLLKDLIMNWQALISNQQFSDLDYFYSDSVKYYGKYVPKQNVITGADKQYYLPNSDSIHFEDSFNLYVRNDSSAIAQLTISNIVDGFYYDMRMFVEFYRVNDLWLIAIESNELTEFLSRKSFTTKDKYESKLDVVLDIIYTSPSVEGELNRWNCFIMNSPEKKIDTLRYQVSRGYSQEEYYSVGFYAYTYGGWEVLHFSYQFYPDTKRLEGNIGEFYSYNRDLLKILDSFDK